MDFETARERTFSARLECRYLLYAPESLGSRGALFVALHGFGSSPEVMLRLTGQMVGAGHAIASLQAPSQFYVGQNSREVGYCWATHKHSDSSVRLHHDMLLHVLEEAGRACAVPPQRRILVGFSQPVGLNYRFAATWPEQVRGVIGICGGVPRNWEDGPYHSVSAALLHIARQGDEFYPPAVAAHYPERLRLRAADVEFHMLAGGHRFPSNARHIVGPWLERILG
ncbi:MAG TPA: hypothetical protein VFA33_23270 [Bryobacteraceae bacterium]|nr:hypothetical protein [Bryobacteraceae bacterium]